MQDTQTDPEIHSWQDQLAIEKIMGRFQGRKEWVRSLALTGNNIKECAERVGINRQHLSSLSRLYSVEFSRHVSISRRILAPLVSEGLGVKDIADRLDRPPVSIKYALMRHFPEYDPPRLRARPLHKPETRSRPSRARARSKPAPQIPQKTFTPATIGPPPNALDLWKVIAAQEAISRRLHESRTGKLA